MVAGGAAAGDEFAPGSFAKLQVLDLVQLGEARRHARFHGAFAEQSGAEGMDRAREEALQVAERCVEALSVRVSRLASRRSRQTAKPILQRQVETAAQLRRSFAREGHGSHALDLVNALWPHQQPCARRASASSRIRRRPRRGCSSADPRGWRGGIRHRRRVNHSCAASLTYAFELRVLHLEFGLLVNGAAACSGEVAERAVVLAGSVHECALA